jgi:anti-sigma B factor antagonist
MGRVDLSTTDALSTSVERRDGATILAVSGAVDLATSPPLEELIGQLVDECPACLIIDLTAVTFFASIGLRILAETHERLAASARFAVVSTEPVTARPIQLTKLDQFLALYPTVEDAITALEA